MNHFNVVCKSVLNQRKQTAPKPRADQYMKDKNDVVSWHNSHKEEDKQIDMVIVISASFNSIRLVIVIFFLPH